MKSAEEYAYVGSELDLFMNATNWKAYWSASVRPYVRGRVLDVGAGLGATFDYLHSAAESWTCLEPDQELSSRLKQRLSTHPKPPEVTCGTIDLLPRDTKFDTVLYIDVLEHIEDDRRELAAVSEHMSARSSLIVLSPAFPFLYSPFDKSVGHWRRYTKRSLTSLTPAGLTLTKVFFLDGIGVFASALARATRRAQPSTSQIQFWDKAIVPVSRVTDALTKPLFGRSIIAVWTKAA